MRLMARVCVVALVAAMSASVLFAQQPAGRLLTQEELFRRNVGSPEDQNTQFPPHRIIGNIYYVGTNSLASFLVTTPLGHILINTSYERTVPIIRNSVEKLGFKFTDVRIILGSHAHGDHMEGDALAKEMTGAQVAAMAEDVPALERMRPGGKPHPIDKVLHDREEVQLGGTTLRAYLTPGHTRGCTTWTMNVQEAGRNLLVVIIGSLGVNPGFVLVNNKDAPQIVEEFERAYRVMRALPADIPLGSHPAMYNLAEKYKSIGKGPNPFIDPAGYKMEIDTVERVYRAALAEQRRAAVQ